MVALPLIRSAPSATVSEWFVPALPTTKLPVMVKAEPGLVNRIESLRVMT